MAKWRLWNVERKKEWLLFAILLTCYAYFFPRWASWSQNSRLDLVMAIVDRGTLAIDEYYQNTGDYAYYNGHYYSDKAPGLSFLAIPFYMVFKEAASTSPVAWLMDKVAHSSAFDATLREGGTGLLSQKIYFAIALYFVTFFTISIPSALLGVLLYRVLGFFIETERPRFFTALTYGLATPAFPYAGMFFSHQLVAFLLFGAFYLIFRRRKTQISHWQLVVVGLFLGWSVITEYPAALIAGGVALYALWSQRAIRTVLWIAVGAFAPGILLMAYDWAIFGSILPKGYFYSALYTEKHHTGFLSLTYPRPDALWGITFGSFRGLFFLAPVLLLAVVGFGIWLRKRVYMPEWSLCTWAVISFLLFNGSSIMWEGGFAVGPRYLLPMLPFMAIGLGVAWGALTMHWAGWLIAGILTLWSVVCVWIETISGQSFPDWTLNPLFNYSLPKFVSGDIARNLGMGLGLHGHWSLIPLVIVVVVIASFWFRAMTGRQSKSVSPLVRDIRGAT
jgi:hypothetical protein